MCYKSGLSCFMIKIIYSSIETSFNSYKEKKFYYVFQERSIMFYDKNYI